MGRAVTLVKALALPLAIALLIAAGVVTVAWPWLERLRWALLIASGVLLVVAVAVNARELRGLSGRRTARYGAGAALVVVLALGVVVLANALSVRHSTRWDLTENKRNSLSPQTIRVLQTLRMPVEAIAFFRSDTPGKRPAEDMLKQYASYSSGKLTWRMEDPDRAPGLAKRYGVESYGTVVLERGGGKAEVRSEKVLDAEEDKLTNALVKLTRDAKRVVYVLKGHGELDMAQSDRPGFSQAKDQLEKANYEVKDLTLARESKVPDDAGILIVAGARTDLLPPELEAFDAYIARGGKALVMLAPFQADGLAKHLARYGFDVGDDLVIEVSGIGRLFGVGPEVPVVTQYEGHTITRDLGNTMTLFPLTRSVEPAKAAPKGVVVQALARTSTQSWGETDRASLQRGEVKPDPQDKKGPVPVAAVATIDATIPSAAPKDPTAGKDAGKAAGGGDEAGKGAAAAEAKPAKARLVVLGTANLASNQFLGAQGNRDLFLNAISWLAEEEDLISIRAKENRNTPIVLTSQQSQAVFWLPVVVLPFAVMVSGIATMVRRRRAG